MSSKSLKNINNFSIYNSLGRIDFLNPIDLTFVNLPKVIKITTNYIGIYADENPDDLYYKR